MITKQRTVLNRINRSSKKKIKILTWATHEGYQTLLGHLKNVEFYLLPHSSKGWDYHTRNLPTNHYIYTDDPSRLNVYHQYDLVLSQERGIQLPLSISIANQIDIPLIHIDHTEPYPNLNDKKLEILRSYPIDINVCISEHNARTWNVKKSSWIINHGIDTNIFNGWDINKVKYAGGCNISNLFVERDDFLDYKLFKSILEHKQIKVFGHNPNHLEYHESINNPEVLANRLSEYRYYVNTTKLSPLPMSLLEAAAVGMPIITTPYQEIPKYFKDGCNCLIASNTREFVTAIEKIENDPVFSSVLGYNARQTILENFSLKVFIDKWERLIKYAVESRG